VVIALASRSYSEKRGPRLKDKQASGPLARRGSSPFPGAILLINLKARAPHDSDLHLEPAELIAGAPVFVRQAYL
jgi:hypothetical protein